MLELINYDGMTDCHGITGNSVTRMHIHFYLLDDLLIDTGSSRLGRISSTFFSRHKIRYAALTHVHEDHSGMAYWLTQKLGIPVFLHEGDHSEAVSPQRLPLYRNVVWGNRRPFYPAAMPPRISTDRYDLDVIPAPGHSPNHVVYHEKSKGWLFTGDLYIATKQNVSFYTENTLQAIASIRHLLTLDWETIFCAHSGIKHNGKEKLRLKLDFFETIQKQVEDLRDKGLSLAEINRYLFPKKDFWELVSRGEWSSFRLISTAAK
ncbi:MAG: Hydroxyacylglutathione hydrolase GloC [Syntrophomonadaceae bacterium]|nr:Hydroxyacylglutathione hydrolase GloC [Bacillota bacterium]